MNTVTRLLSALVVSSAFLAVPMIASADETPTALHKGGHGGRHHDSKDRPSFPMKGDEFRQHVETRIEKAKARVEEHARRDRAFATVLQALKNDLEDDATPGSDRAPRSSKRAPHLRVVK